MSLNTQINKGETNILEFKETFRYDVKTNNNNKSLKNEVSKAVCGMLNSEGGKVLIGVADNKTIEGIQRDLNLYGKGDESTQLDRLLIDLNKLITDSIDIKSKKFLKINVVEIDGKKIIKIEIKPSNEPFFLSGEIFYVRDGPRTIQLLGKKMGDYISDRSRTLNVKSPEKIFKEKLEVITPKFQKWAQDKLKQNLSLKVNKNNPDGSIYDYILGCIVPTTLSKDLINFNSSLIKDYINDYSIIKRSQKYKTPDYARQYEQFFGEDILIFPNGTIYFCQIYSTFHKEQPDFSLGFLESGGFERLVVKQLKEKYSAPFSYIKRGTLSSLLEVVCFLFNPKCKIKMVNSPTDLFHLEILVPNMIYEGNRRVLSSFGGFPMHKSYQGTNKDITFHKLFRFNEIAETIEVLKSHIMEYYQNPASGGYIGF
jgi:hypothetical protein